MGLSADWIQEGKSSGNLKKLFRISSANTHPEKCALLPPWGPSSPVCRRSPLYSRIRPSPVALCTIYTVMKPKFQLPARTCLNSSLDNSIWMPTKYLKFNMAKMEFFISPLLPHLSLNPFSSLNRHLS